MVGTANASRTGKIPGSVFFLTGEIMNIKLSVLEKAIKEAKSSAVVRGKVGCVAFMDNGRIIASASNAVFYGHEGKWTVHAEAFVFSKLLKLRALQRFRKINMLVVRYKPSLDCLAIARPCPQCADLLRNTGIKVFHTNTDGNIVEFEE